MSQRAIPHPAPDRRGAGAGGNPPTGEVRGGEGAAALASYGRPTRQMFITVGENGVTPTASTGSGAGVAPGGGGNLVTMAMFEELKAEMNEKVELEVTRGLRTQSETLRDAEAHLNLCVREVETLKGVLEQEFLGGIVSLEERFVGRLGLLEGRYGGLPARVTSLEGASRSGEVADLKRELQRAKQVCRENQVPFMECVHTLTGEVTGFGLRVITLEEKVGIGGQGRNDMKRTPPVATAASSSSVVAAMSGEGVDPDPVAGGGDPGNPLGLSTTITMPSTSAGSSYWGEDSVRRLRVRKQPWSETASSDMIPPPTKQPKRLMATPMPPTPPATDAEEERRYCLCNQIGYGEMVACDNQESCLQEWFHYDCVGITVAPQGKWYCPTCSRSRPPTTVAGQSDQGQRHN